MNMLLLDAHFQLPYINIPSTVNPRLPRLTKLLDSVLQGTLTITPSNAPLFLEAICAQLDVVACINKLVFSTNGLSSLQAAMQCDQSVAFLNGHAATFVSYIQAPDLPTIGNGSLLQQIVSALVEPPLFWAALSKAFRGSELSEQGELAFSGLLLLLITLPADKAEAYRKLAQDPEISARLSLSSYQSTRNFGQKIQAVLSMDGDASPADITYTPGGRHDNDFADFREISILPTADEIMSTEPPFLRHSSIMDDPEAKTDVSTYIDNQFRLLREDMLYEMREELQIALGVKKGKHRGTVIDGLSLTDVYCGTSDRRFKWGLAFKLYRDPWIFQGKKGHDERKAALTQNYRFLQHQSLTCLIVDGEVVAFPTIHRDEDLLSERPSVLVLQVQGSVSTTRTLLKLQTAKTVKLIQINTPIFSYEPILKALQRKTTLSLSSELLSSKEDGAATPVGLRSSGTRVVKALREDPAMDLRQVLDIQKPTSIRLDSSQADSLISGLTQSLTLIQGPPGTGKSFIGALLTKCLHDTSSQRILVVCYTNHALDQFLEDLLDIGIPESSMVRLGSKSTSRTEPLTLYKQNSSDFFHLTRMDWEEIDPLKSSSESSAKHLIRCYRNIARRYTPFPELLKQLKSKYSRFFEAFRVPEAEDGMKLMGDNNRAVDSTYLVNRWATGKNAGLFQDLSHVQAAADIWSMKKPSRTAQLAEWRMERRQAEVSEFCRVAKDYNTCQDRLSEIFGQKPAHILREKRIIGCTTTAAAKYSVDIQAASPGILLVEEAGEILESHIITALGSMTKKLILIGDHKQLRPKVNNYQLTVEKGEGYDLNRSMFERLVLKGYPHATLNEQHRMRPEISALIRQLTYPDLVDAPTTQNRPDLRGVQDNIVFIDHSHKEDDMPNTAERRDPNTLSSKQNTHEAEMILKILRYIAQQGYGSEKVVILTPYLGQLHKFQDILKVDHDPVLNDLDSYDLVRAGLVPAATAKATKKSIRIATIDNYQGEESEIVLISLVRSNSAGDIGFMFSPERLNVLLSRARNALIMIGNADTFLRARKGQELWTSLFDLLSRDGHVYDGLPVRCERHPTRTAVLRSPTDFDDKAPDGGCQEPCGTPLNCGLHSCPSKCHQLYDHSKMKCEATVTDNCLQGHIMTWKCFSNRPKSCRKCDQEAQLAAVKRKKALEDQQRRDAEAAEHAREMAELEEKIAEQLQSLQIVQQTQAAEAEDEWDM